MSVDKNGLVLSTQSASGYKGVTIIDGIPGFIPYVNIHSPDLQDMKRERGFNGYPIGFKNVQALWLDENYSFTDVRDAAYIAQEFEKNLEENLYDWFMGDATMIKHPPKWEHEVHPSATKQISTTLLRRAERKKKPKKPSEKKTTVQLALYEFIKDRKGDYKVTADDAPKIRYVMEDYLEMLGHRPTKKDYMDAAEVGFEPYKIV